MRKQCFSHLIRVFHRGPSLGIEATSSLFRDLAGNTLGLSSRSLGKGFCNCRCVKDRCIAAVGRSLASDRYSLLHGLMIRHGWVRIRPRPSRDTREVGHNISDISPVRPRPVTTTHSLPMCAQPAEKRVFNGPELHEGTARHDDQASFTTCEHDVHPVAGYQESRPGCADNRDDNKIRFFTYI